MSTREAIVLLTFVFSLQQKGGDQGKQHRCHEDPNDYHRYHLLLFVTSFHLSHTSFLICNISVKTMADRES